MSEKSCLVQKLSYYIDIDEVSERHLASLEEAEQTYITGETVYDETVEVTDLYVVKRGWFYAFTDLSDGRRQIVKIHHPGDVIGLPDIAFKNATVSLRAAEDGCLCPFPKDKLDVIFRESPRLTALLFTLEARDQAVFFDLIRATGRMSAQERIAFFLLDLHSRLRIANPRAGDSLRMPLNQVEIGDYLGLTNVYVSKTLTRLETAGLIAREGGRVQILDFAELIEMCDFTDRYMEIDTSWFPQ